MNIQLLTGLQAAQALEFQTTAMENSAQDAEAVTALAGQRQQNNEELASSYFDAIADVQQQITAAQAAIGISQASLTRTIRARQTTQRAGLQQAVYDANHAAQVAEIKEGIKLAGGIFAAILAAPATGGLSLVGGVVSTVTYLANDEDVREQGLAFLRDGLQLYQDMQQDCGTLDPDECTAILDDIAASKSDLERAIDSLDSLQDLRRLNEQLTVNGQTISAADLPNVACMGMALDSIDASFQIQILHDSAEYAATDTATAQLFSLMKAKVHLMGDYMQTKLAAQDQQLEHDIMLRRAQEAAGQAAGTAQQADSVRRFYNARLHSQQLVGAQVLMSMIRAYEFMLLRHYSHTDRFLSGMRDARLEPAAVLTLLEDTRSGLATQWQLDVAGSNNCGWSGWGMVDINLADVSGNAFAQTGVVTVSLPTPQAPGYSHLVYADTPKVFLIGLNGAVENVHVTFWKKGVSTIVDDGGELWTFTHKESNPPLVFSYNPSTCEGMGSSGGAAQTNLCDTSALYMHPSRNSHTQSATTHDSSRDPGCSVKLTDKVACVYSFWRVENLNRQPRRPRPQHCDSCTIRVQPRW